MYLQLLSVIMAESVSEASASCQRLAMGEGSVEAVIRRQCRNWRQLQQDGNGRCLIRLAGSEHVKASRLQSAMRSVLKAPPACRAGRGQ